MGSKRKSTSNRKYKEMHHSRSHRNRKSNRNSSHFIEPFYFVDPMLSHSNNVPFFFQTPFYGSTQSSWGPVPSAGCINSPTSLFPNGNHPAQLSIGPLYLLGKGSESEQNPVPLKDLNPISIGINRPMQNNVLHERPPKALKNGHPISLNLAGESYSLPTTTEVYSVINTLKSQNHTQHNLIDTPTQYDYEIPVSKRIGSCLSYNWPLENSETSSLASLQNNELSEKECGISIPPEHPRGNLTVMRVTQDEVAEPNHPIEGSTLNQNLTWNKKKRGNCRKICIEVPVGINNSDKKRSDKIRAKCDPRQTDYSEGLNCNTYRSVKRDNRKVREMTTQDSINDLYRKINDIQYSLGAPHMMRPDSRSVAFEQCVHSGQVPYYNTDMTVARSNTVTRSISPIKSRTIENTDSCCCFCCPQRLRNVLETRISSPNLTRPELSNNPIQGSSEYFCHSVNQNDGIHYVEMHYPPFFQPDTGLRIEPHPLRNENLRIVIDQDAECQSSSLTLNEHDAYPLPIQEICNRPCNCLQNTSPNSYTKCVICCDHVETTPKEFHGIRQSNLNFNGPTMSDRHSATKDNSTLCTSSDLLPNPENSSVTKASIEQNRPCNCDFNKELYDIMNKIEDNIISKLEGKTFLLNSESRRPRPEEIQDYKISKSVQIRDSELAELRNLPTRLGGSSLNTSVLRNSMRESKHGNSIQEQIESDDQFLIKEQPRSSQEKREMRDSEYEVDQGYREKSRLSDKNADGEEYKRSKKSSSELRRSTREKTKDSSFGSGRRSTLSDQLRKSRKSGSSNERRPFPSVKRISKNRSSGQSSVQVLTAVPYFVNGMQSSKYTPKLSKNVVNLENDKYLLSDSTVDLNEKDGKNTNSYQIRRIKLPGPKRHIYILVKRRNDKKNISRKESKKTFNISSVRACGLKGISAEKNYLLKKVKPEKIRKIYIKSKEEI